MATRYVGLDKTSWAYNYKLCTAYEMESAPSSHRVLVHYDIIYYLLLLLSSNFNIHLFFIRYYGDWKRNCFSMNESHISGSRHAMLFVK